MSDINFIWTEKYRPKKISDCILSPALERAFTGIVASGEIPNMIFYGPSGVGKTTVAKAICDEAGLNFMVINSSDERGIDTLRTKVKNYATSLSINGKKKVVILDESDSITPDAQLALRGMIEEYSINCTFIFTCNYREKLIDAIHSRTTSYDFKLPLDISLAKKIVSALGLILQQESVTFDQKALQFIVSEKYPDVRSMILFCQKLATSDKSVTLSTVTPLIDNNKINDLLPLIRSKHYNKVHTWVMSQSDLNFVKIFRSLYDGLKKDLDENEVAMLIIIIGKYQYQAAHVADQHVNLLACIAEIIVSVLK